MINRIKNEKLRLVVEFVGFIPFIPIFLFLIVWLNWLGPWYERVTGKKNVESKMNEKIKELEKQATETVKCGLNGTSTSEVFNRKKFAELIVKECAKACEKNSYLALNGWQRAKQIKEHFGVKE
jgi:hypothetical protein